MKKVVGVKRIILACGHTVRGLKYVWTSEAAFRQEMVLAAILLPLACWLDISQVERALLFVSVMLVLITEILNSAIEAVVDRIGYDHHPLSGHAKDMGSAAVGIALLLLVIVWFLILN